VCNYKKVKFRDEFQDEEELKEYNKHLNKLTELNNRYDTWIQNYKV
jgi:hypothetical protein